MQTANRYIQSLDADTVYLTMHLHMLTTCIY